MPKPCLLSCRAAVESHSSNMGRLTFALALLAVVALSGRADELDADDGDEEIAAQSGTGPQFQESVSQQEMEAVSVLLWARRALPHVAAVATLPYLGSGLQQQSPTASMRSGG